jgi:hypothetical protein
VLGSVALPGRAAGVVVRRGFAYVKSADGDSHPVHVVDVRDPGAPTLVSSLEGQIVERGGLAVAVRGDHAFVLTCRSCLEVFDVSDPTAPRALAAEDLPELDARALALGDNTLAAAGARLTLLDVSVPDRASVLSELALDPPATDIALATARVLLAVDGGARRGAGLPSAAVGAGWMAVVDVTDPIEPVLDARYFDPLGLRPSRLEWIGRADRLYARADAVTETLVVDLSDPTRPRVESAVPGLAELVGLAVQRPYGYATLGQTPTRLVAFDLNDPVQPRPLQEIPLSEPFPSIAVGADRGALYRMDFHWPTQAATTTIQAMDLSDPASPRVGGRLVLPGFQVASGAVTAGHLFLVGEPHEEPLQVVDLRDADRPRVVHRARLQGVRWAWELVPRYPYAYVFASNGLRVLDITNPSEVREIGRLSGRFRHGFRSPDDLLFGYGPTGVTAWDIAEPWQPRRLAGFDAPEHARLTRIGAGDVVLAGDHLYASFQLDPEALGQGLTVLELVQSP